ncbi:MAG: alpha/beta hydrolase [Thermotogota bacterium]|nr:alpha/beta hydrolase [Thermotogota bacterium]
MKKSLVIFLILIAFSFAFASSEDLQIVSQYINAFFGKDFSTAYELQNDMVKAQLDEKAMEQTHQYIVNNYGNPVSIIEIKQDTQDVYKIFVFYMHFDNAYLNVNVVLDQNKKVAQFLIQPAPAPSSKPNYANPDNFVESEVSFGEEPWKIPGTLTIPKNTESFPMVIIIGGSGPTDRNGTVGPNQPYRDIAWGLSTNGIATLRYDKRTKVYGEKIIEEEIEPTMQFEYIEDIFQAINFVSKMETVSEIYLAGHSLGGIVTPYSGKKSESVDGIILLAAPARKLAQISLDQNKYFAPISGITEEQLGQIEKMFKELLDHKLPPETIIDPNANLKASYYYDTDKYQTLVSLEDFKKPVLVLQGEEDFQTLMDKDFNVLKEKFSDKKNFTFRSFERLNHLFIETETDIFHTTEEYTKQGFVNKRVIETIINWIKSN